MERGVQRWIVDISKWNPTAADFSTALSLLPQHEHISITRFVKLEDRKRAFVSRLLQYALVHQTFEIPFDEIVIKRTVEGKPYLKLNRAGVELSSFNFSVSHHGDFVAIASEPFFLVGLDIVFHVAPVNQDCMDFISSFASYFSSTEWYKIINAGSCDDMLKELYRYWTLKEAYIKAIGSGLGYRLDQLEFQHNDWNNICMRINNKDAKRWKFWHFELKDSLYVSVARGCPTMATESYKEVLGQVDLNDNAYRIGFSSLSNPNFLWRTVEQLMPC